MIATFVIDWPVLMLIGFVFAFFAPADGWWRSRAFVAGAVSASVFTLTALVGYLVAPDWMWMYFLEAEEAAWSVPLVLLAYPFVFAVSFAAGVAIAQISRGALIAGAIGAALLELLVIALTWDRYQNIGSRAEWVQGDAHALFSVAPTGPARTIGLLGPLFLAVAAAGLYAAARERREASARR